MYLSQIADRISFIVGGGDEFSISLGVYIIYIRNIIFGLQYLWINLLYLWEIGFLTLSSGLVSCFDRKHLGLVRRTNVMNVINSEFHAEQQTKETVQHECMLENYVVCVILTCTISQSLLPNLRFVLDIRGKVKQNEMENASWVFSYTSIWQIWNYLSSTNFGIRRGTALPDYLCTTIKNPK